MAPAMKPYLRLYQGEDNSNGALYYCNPQYIFSDSVKAWFDSLEVVLKLDGQLFYIG